jgi:hypothetical protein
MLHPRTSILQLTYGMYRAMGMTECYVALSEDEYVQLALRLVDSLVWHWHTYLPAED